MARLAQIGGGVVGLALLLGTLAIEPAPAGAALPGATVAVDCNEGYAVTVTVGPNPQDDLFGLSDQGPYQQGHNQVLTFPLGDDPALEDTTVTVFQVDSSPAADIRATQQVTLDCLAPNPEAEALVRALYEAVLGRQPDSDGLTYWVGRLDAGVPPARLAETLARTREGWMQVVRQHYRLALNREGDVGGVAYWTDRLQASNAPDGLLTTLFASPEVFTARSGSTNTGYVTYLYHRVLDREPDASGLAYWVGRLDGAPGQASVARRGVARSLVFTPEGIRRQVDANYNATCGVATPADEVPTLTARFKAARLNPSTLRAAIVIAGCPE